MTETSLSLAAPVAGEPGAAAGAVALAVGPNPTAGRAAVAVTLAEARPVRVSVSDALGREVAVVHDGVLGAGAHRLGLDVRALPAGVYVVRAAAGPQTSAARLVVAR